MKRLCFREMQCLWQDGGLFCLQETQSTCSPISDFLKDYQEASPPSTSSLCDAEVLRMTLGEKLPDNHFDDSGNTRGLLARSAPTESISLQVHAGVPCTCAHVAVYSRQRKGRTDADIFTHP